MHFYNVGLSREGSLKYFLDFSFQIDNKCNKTDLEKKYLNKIEEMFG